VNSTAAIFLILFCYLSIKASFENIISAGAAGGIIMLYYTLWVTLEGISVQQDQIYDYIIALRRFIRLCLEKSIIDTSAEKNIINSWERISIVDFSFRYHSESKYSLKNINLEINKGEIVALVGPSGSGKSTLVKLILGLYQPSNGEILIDNKNLNIFNHSSWLKKIAFVPQEIELFDGNIRENILLGSTSLEFYNDILKKTCLFDLVNSLPKNDLTLIGERGLKLSGGQKQRIGLARALLKNPEFLVLDEATSALDSITENQIQDSLFDNLRNKTLLIIAHRLSTIRNANKIVVLNEGEIDDVGNFDYLLNKNGLFTKMWGIQGLRNIF